MRWILFIVALTACATPLHADEDARARFEQAAQAIADARSLAYSIKFYGEGGIVGGLTANIEGDVIVERIEAETLQWRFRAHGTHKERDQPLLEYDILITPETIRWIDHEQKRVMERPANAARGKALQSREFVYTDEILAAEPFAKELAADTMSLEGTETINGEPCEIVKVALGNKGIDEHQWYFAESDNLPRKHIRILPQGMGKMITEFSDVQLGVLIQPDDFTIDAPDGYREDTGQRANPVRTEPLPEPETDAPPRARPEPPRRQDPPAPRFELENGWDRQGELVSLASYEGRVVVLEFWGSWCLPCGRVGAKLQELKNEFKDQPVSVVGIACRERDWSSPATYMRQHDFDYDLLLKGDSVARAYRVTRYPTIVVIDTEGRLIHQRAGVPENLDEAFREIATVIENALPAQPAAAAGQ